MEITPIIDRQSNNIPNPIANFEPVFKLKNQFIREILSRNKVVHLI